MEKMMIENEVSGMDHGIGRVTNGELHSLAFLAVSEENAVRLAKVLSTSLAHNQTDWAVVRLSDGCVVWSGAPTEFATVAA